MPFQTDFSQKAFLLIGILFLCSCGSAKSNRVIVKKNDINTRNERLIKNEPTIVPNPTAQNIIDFAKSFEGVRYKFGGTTKKGMDCSGLVYRCFGEYDITMPRTTTALSSAGDWIDVKAVIPGDLVFFATQKNSRKINHVGIVTEVTYNDFAFIHASTSQGVMISKLSDTYWYLAYVQARRFL